MARRTVIELKDDLDGSDATKTVSFAYQGTEYEIDLSQQNLKRLDEALGPFVEHGRKVTGRRRRGGGTQRGAGVDTRAVRQWAREQGIDVSDRGRIPRDVLERYEKEASRPS